MLSPLLHLIANSNVKQINLTLSIDAKTQKACVIVQSQLDINSQAKLAHPSNTGSVADVYSKLSTPLIITVNSIDEIDIAIASQIHDFVQTSEVALADSNVQNALASISSAITAANELNKSAKKQKTSTQPTKPKILPIIDSQQQKSPFIVDKTSNEQTPSQLNVSSHPKLTSGNILSENNDMDEDDEFSNLFFNNK